MEKRIKTVWILTIITALLMIGGQTYWLYNQYCYSVNEYMHTMHEQIVKVEKEVFEARYTRRTQKLAMTVNYKIEMPDSTDSKGNTNCIVSFYNITQEHARLAKEPDTYEALQKRLTERRDTFCIKNIPNEVLLDATSRYSTEISNSLALESLDSAFLANGIIPLEMEKITLDSIAWNSTYAPTGKLFPPQMRVTYPYNPFQKQAFTATFSVPLNPLIRQMAWQLMGSILLILLLIFCLIYQIKTILKQRKIDEMRKSFVNTMIHELKRPVQTLKMCVAFLNNKSMRTDEQAMDEVLKDSMFELDNLSAYLAKVRDMTRADYEHTPLNIRTFNLCETVDKLIRLNNAPADKQVILRPHYEMESPLVTADAVHLANMISNLIENAIKYSGKEVCIDIYCLQKGRTLTIRIADNGIGIPASEQGKVFDKFYRGNNMPDRNIPGIGLGLSYVKLLTEAHHGTISLTSQPGRGTTFSIVLPQ